MKRDDFLNLTLEKQIDHFNKGLSNGLSISKVAKDLGISKSITEKFKKKGYYFESNNFKKKDTIPSDEEDNNLPTTKKLVEPTINEASSDKPTKGRPPKIGNFTKHSVSMDDNTWITLRVYAIRNGTDASAIIEKLTKDFLRNNN